MSPWFQVRAKRLGILLSVLGSLAFAGCAIEPITGRRTFALLSEGEANTMGAQAFGQLMAEAKLGGTAAENALVLSVAERIAKVTDARMAEEGREPYQWEFKVIDDPQTANAFALPGGKVAVYTGILPFTKDANGLAVVLGHEIGHAYAQHGRKRVSEQVLSKFTLESVQTALGGDQASETAKLAVAALGVGYQVGVELPFSRSDESSADEIGLILMAEAGYDPRGAVAFWQRMSAAGGGAPMEFLSTHPSGETRIRDIEKLLPKAVAIYEKTGGAAPR